MNWKIYSVFTVFLLGLVPRLAASRCAAFNLHAIKPKGDGFTVFASSDSFDNSLVKTYGPREKRTWGHKFLTSICLLYAECYGSRDTDMVFANCYASGMQYVRRDQAPYKVAQNLENYINGLPNDVSLRPRCYEPKVEIKKDLASDDSILVASGLTGKSYNFILRDTEEDSRYLMVLQVLNWMCLEYARCLNTLKQAAVQHKCIMVGREELKPAHTELMVMQLDLYMKALVHGDVRI